MCALYAGFLLTRPCTSVSESVDKRLAKKGTKVNREAMKYAIEHLRICFCGRVSWKRSVSTHLSDVTQLPQPPNDSRILLKRDQTLWLKPVERAPSIAVDDVSVISGTVRKDVGPGLIAAACDFTFAEAFRSCTGGDPACS